MQEVDAEISEMKLFLNGRARFVAEGYLAQVRPLKFWLMIVYINSVPTL
jgi:ARP2/3 complex 20 kDa subunit (ARPC4)